MNNFWIPEEINLGQDLKDYPKLEPAVKTALDKTLSFLIFLDSIQTANLPNIGEVITANEINLCLTIQAFPVSYTHLVLPEDLDYDQVQHLSLEGRQKLKAIQPHTLGQASRISGVSPADVAMLAMVLEQRHRKEQ